MMSFIGGTQVTATYSYDATVNGNYGIGRRTGMNMNNGQVSNSWKYDERGRITSATVTAGSAYTTQWSYNYADLPLSMTYPDGEVVSYSYDTHMLLDTLTGTAPYVSTTNYDSAGRVTSRSLGNGLTPTYTYCPWIATTDCLAANHQLGRLQNVLTGTLQDLNYTYDAAGNVKQVRDDIAVETSDYTYDALNRLTSWKLNNGTPETYDYADTTTGNLWHKAGSTYSYNDSAHKHAVTNVGSNQYAYDANGNMITRTVNGQTFNLRYDAENRLMTVSGAITANFLYDGDGNRVQSTIANVTTTFVGNYYEVSGSTITKYYYAGSSRVAMSVNGTVSYLLSDQLGSTTITTDASGGLVSELRYKAWGEVRYTSGATPTKYTYTGQYSNVGDFGLMYYNARWYDPVLGRFAQADTIVPGGVQGYDRYAYVANNPILFNDPSGHREACGASGQDCQSRADSDRQAEQLRRHHDRGERDGTGSTIPADPNRRLEMGSDSWNGVQRIVAFSFGALFVLGGLTVLTLGGLIAGVGLVEVAGLTALAPPLALPSLLHAGPAVAIGGMTALAGVGITGLGAYMIWRSMAS